MLKHIDRLLVFAYFKAYAVCLVSLLSLYVVVDLFTNLDEFTHNSGSLLYVLRHIGSYYAFQVALIFDRLCEPIVLLAGMFTIAWVQRNNELLPLLSAGVSTQRVVLPVLASACMMLGLAVVNQEFIIPRIASRLLQHKSDPSGDKEIRELTGAWEPNGIHITGVSAHRKGMIVKDFSCHIPYTVAASALHITAREAHYNLDWPDGRGKGWLLTGAESEGLGTWNNSQILEVIPPGKCFLHTERADFDAVIRPRNWFNLASTLDVWRELRQENSTTLTAMAVLFHMRITRTILGMVLVFMGLSVILRDQNRNVFISAGMCLVLCALFFGACFACKWLANGDLIPPALAAWLPVFCFGPLAAVMFDAVHT